jgi:hypothetical protein
MLIFTMHIAYSLLLLVVLAAMSMLIWSLHNKGTGGAEIAKFFGAIVYLLAILGMACMLYYSMIYWQQGAFTNATPMTEMMGTMNKKMMEEKMQGKGMMQGNMPAGASKQ